MWFKTASFLKRWYTNTRSQPPRRLILDGGDYCLWVLSVQLASCDHPDSYISTGLFISPSGISELDCATTKTDTAERSISIDRESLQIFFCTRGLGVLAGSTARG